MTNGLKSYIKKILFRPESVGIEEFGKLPYGMNSLDVIHVALIV